MVASKNEHTGDELKSKIPSEKYRDNYDLIFGKKKMKFIVTTTIEDKELVLDAGDDVVLKSLQDARRMSESHRLAGDTNLHIIYKLETMSSSLD